MPQAKVETSRTEIMNLEKLAFIFNLIGLCLELL